MNSKTSARLDKLWDNVMSFYEKEGNTHASLLDINIHGCDHIYRVWNNVRQIENHGDLDEKVNYELTQAAAILHDIGYLLIDSNNVLHEDHAKESMNLSETFLRNLSFSDNEIALVQKIIGSHHSDQFGQMSLEQKILLLADQLDLLGLDGILREFIRLSSTHQNRDKMAKIIFQKSSQRYKKLVKLKICQKLLREKWHQSEDYLMKIIDAGYQTTSYKTGDQS